MDNNVVNLAIHRYQNPDISDAMRTYLSRADPVSGRLPERDLEGRLIMIRTVRACLWRGLISETVIDYDVGSINGAAWCRPIPVYHITNAGKTAAKRRKEQ